MFAIDDAMGDVVQRSTQPGLAAIKLAWWRERLEELDEGKIPAEPRLQAAAAELLPRGIKGSEVAELEAGWTELLTEEPDAEKVLQRGPTLFALAARLLQADWAALPIAGRLYVAGDWKRRLRAVPGFFRVTDIPPVPKQLRPLTGLSALGKRDLERDEPQGTPARAWTLFRHRLTGRL